MSDSGVPYEKKMQHLAKVLNYHDGCPGADLNLAKDYLVEASIKINSLRPVKDCHSCRFWRITDCQLAGKLPPDNIIKSGCELWEDAFEIPWN